VGRGIDLSSQPRSSRAVFFLNRRSNGSCLRSAASESTSAPSSSDSAPEWRTEMTNRFAAENQIITGAAA